MNDYRRFDALGNALVVIAVASAFVYQLGGAAELVATCVGLSAAVLSLGIYFVRNFGGTSNSKECYELPRSESREAAVEAPRFGKNQVGNENREEIADAELPVERSIGAHRHGERMAALRKAMEDLERSLDRERGGGLDALDWIEATPEDIQGSVAKVISLAGRTTKGSRKHKTATWGTEADPKVMGHHESFG